MYVQAARKRRMARSGSEPGKNKGRPEGGLVERKEPGTGSTLPDGAVFLLPDHFLSPPGTVPSTPLT